MGRGLWNDFHSRQGGEETGRETGCGKKPSGISEKKTVTRKQQGTGRGQQPREEKHRVAAHRPLRPPGAEHRSSCRQHLGPSLCGTAPFWASVSTPVNKEAMLGVSGSATLGLASRLPL